MSVHEVTYYQIKCDCCGEICDDYGDFAAWSDPGSASDQLPDDWRMVRVVGSNVAEDICPDCWCWPEDHPDYLGDDSWTGSDDEVRKHGENHHSSDLDAGPLGSGHSPRATGASVGDCGGSVEEPSTHLIHGSASSHESSDPHPADADSPTDQAGTFGAENHPNRTQEES